MQKQQRPPTSHQATCSHPNSLPSSPSHVSWWAHKIWISKGVFGFHVIMFHTSLPKSSGMLTFKNTRKCGNPQHKPSRVATNHQETTDRVHELRSLICSSTVSSDRNGQAKAVLAHCRIRIHSVMCADEHKSLHAPTVWAPYIQEVKRTADFAIQS